MFDLVALLKINGIMVQFFLLKKRETAHAGGALQRCRMNVFLRLLIKLIFPQIC